MTSSPHGLYAQGHTRATMRRIKRTESASWRKSHKSPPSSDWRLQPASMKLELLVTVSQHITVNTFPGLVHTARHTTKVGNT